MNTNHRSKFPIFRNNPELVYLDSASTTQKPKSVIESLVNFYSKYNANVHRGLYKIAEKSTEEYERAREEVAKFINAESDEIFFVSSATDGLNLIASMLQNSGLIDKKPRILLSELEHHSNILPWQRLNPRELDYLMISSDFNIASGIPDKDYDIMALTHGSNVTGTILPVEKLIENSDRIKFTVLDATQTIAHRKVDVKKLDVDFLVFSSHKAYGPGGVGVVYGRKEILKSIDPFRVGGGMIKEVTKNSATWADLPEKFEAGTPPIGDVIALAEAIRFIKDIGIPNIKSHEESLRIKLIEELSKIEGLNIYHPPTNTDALCVISFNIEGIHPHDIAQFLGDYNICVRAGHHCTQILHRDVLNIPASVRVSVGIYNNISDIEKLVEGLKKVIKYYK